MLKNRRILFITIVGLIAAIAGGGLFYEYSRKNIFNQSTKPVAPLSHHEFEAAQSEMVRLTQQEDPRASFAYLRSDMQKSPATARECHPLLHYVGQAAYKKYKNFNTAMSYQDEMCNSGYIHGVIEAYFLTTNDVQSALKTACSSQVSQSTFKQWECYHGVGHGVMYYTGKNLPQSLSLCQNLPTDFARGSCVNGVFMERFIIIDHSGAQVPNATSINTGMCAQQTDSYKPDCYSYAPAAYLQRHTNDYPGAFKDCIGVGKGYISSCVYGIGGEAMKENITRPQVALSVCKDGLSKYADLCIAGAINILINQTGSTNSVATLCNTTFIQFKNVCTEQIKKWNSIYSF